MPNFTCGCLLLVSEVLKVPPPPPYNILSAPIYYFLTSAKMQGVSYGWDIAKAIGEGEGRTLLTVRESRQQVGDLHGHILHLGVSQRKMCPDGRNCRGVSTAEKSR